ncbi:hypothetical protein JCM10908_002916 [Rhodotorula pacifica]|uniref:uncharacterized protein n=1 Tax=Rhodotorula pacifica TaxID=1495444 RepID=UPI00316F9397
MPTATSTSRLAGLPRSPKVPKKAPKRKSASPPKPKAVPLPRPVPPRPAPLPASVITLNPSDDDTLSDVSSSSDDSDVIIEVVTSKATTVDKGKGKAIPPPPPTSGKKLPSLTALPALPALPPLPFLPTAAPKKTGTSALPQVVAPKATTGSASPAVAPPTKPRSHKRKDVAAPGPSTPSASPIASTSASKPPVASTSATPSAATKPSAPRTAASPSPALAEQAAYAPHHASSRSTPSAPQRMSLRQVLALSLQEAEEKAKSQPSTRENSPDATALSRVAAGSAANARRERSELAQHASSVFGSTPTGSQSHASRADRGKGKVRLSDVSDLELAGDDLSDLSSLSSDDEGLDATAARRSKALEKIEERQIRAEVKRKQAQRSADAMDLDRYADGAEADLDDNSSDEDDLAQAWDRNVLAIERLHHRLSPDADLGEAVAIFDEGEDSDVGVTEIPPGNGLGVVTWSDYDFDDEDDDDNEDDDEDEEEDQLAAALADMDAEDTANEGHTAAGDLEDELEQLFALSEAVAGPINPDEYDFGNVWLEALSDVDDYDNGSDDLDSNDEGDSDAEMIFGPDGELKRLFGRRRKHQRATVESSAGETDDTDDSSTSAEEDGRIGVTVDDVQPLDTEDADADEGVTTSDSESMDEATDSSCSDTDIYRYAPRTGALAAVQAPTSADLASLAPPALTSSSKPKQHGRKKCRHKARAMLASIPERTPVLPPAPQPPTRKGPVMGSFEPVERQPAKTDAAFKVVIVDESGVPAPSPFAAPKKSRRRLTADTPSRRARSDSRVSTTSGTSGGESLDVGSNLGSPVLANVVFDFDFDSMLHESLLAEEDEDEAADMEVDSSSETDTGVPATRRAVGRKSSQPTSALSDLSRWARIPIGAFRSRTTGGDTAPALSQAFAAQAAETGKSKRKAIGRAHAAATSAMLRDRKAAQSLNHTLGSPGQGSAAPSKRAIASRMLTSPVIAPTVRDPARLAPSNAKPTSVKKSKRSRSTTSKKALIRDRNGVKGGEGAELRAHASAASGSTPAAPTANLPPLHSPLFRSMTDPRLREPSHLQL